MICSMPRRDRSLVLITHRPVGLDRMDEIIVMEDGKIQARGTHEELLETSTSDIAGCGVS